MAPQSTRQDRCLDVQPVFVAVADQKRFGVIQKGKCNQQFGFAAGLQAEVPAASAAHQLLHHVALLIAFHREDALVATGVAVSGDGPFEGAMKALQPILKDVVETNQKRQAEIPAPQLVHQFDQIQAAAAFALGLNTHMTAAVDGEIGLPPTLQAIQSGTVLDRPALTLSHRLTPGMAGI